MTKYKLTTDLIADCRALIPENLERLSDDNWVFTENNNGVTLINNWFIHDYIEDKSFRGFAFFSHCIRTIPEFQEENPERENFKYRIINNNKKIKLTEDKSEWAKVYKTHNAGLAFALSILPKTIASATLHGQGEYPPSTLEELIESYKNVMSS